MYTLLHFNVIIKRNGINNSLCYSSKTLYSSVFYFAKCTDTKIKDGFVYWRVGLIANAVGTRHLLKASGFAVQYLILLVLCLSELTQPSTRFTGLLFKTLLAKRSPALSQEAYH